MFARSRSGAISLARKISSTNYYQICRPKNELPFVEKKYRCEVDFKPSYSGGASWAATNVVLFDKEEDVLLLFLSRAFFVRDSYHGESLSCLIGIGCLVKLNAIPFNVYSDNSSVINDLKGSLITKNCGDIIRRCLLLLSYTPLKTDNVFQYISRNYNRPADTLGSLYIAYGGKRTYVEKVWERFIETFSRKDHTQARSYSISTSSTTLPTGLEGRLKGLVWKPHVTLKREKEIPEYYGRRTLTIEGQDPSQFRGVDFGHWCVILDPSFKEMEDTKANLLDKYVRLISRVTGSEAEAKSRIYSATFQRYLSIGCYMDQKTVETLECFSEVLVAIPDFYIVPEIPDYGGDKVSDGQLVERSEEDQKLVDAADESPASLPGPRRKKMSDEERDEIDEAKGRLK